jgi:hypothetical protein
MGKHSRFGAAVIVGAVGFVGLAVAQLEIRPVIGKSGNWSVRRGVDSMTDEPTCTALYKERFDV